MKKLTLALAAAMALSSAVANAQSSGATVFFEGHVTNDPCAITVSKTVPLGSYPIKVLGTDGKGEWGTAEIRLTNCDLEKEGTSDFFSTVTISVPGGGAAAANAPSIWANMGSSDNVGVEVQIKGVPVTPTGISSIEANLTEDGAIIPVRGRTVKTTGALATVGSVKAEVAFTAKFK